MCTLGECPSCSRCLPTQGMSCMQIKTGCQVPTMRLPASFLQAQRMCIAAEAVCPVIIMDCLQEMPTGEQDGVTFQHLPGYAHNTLCLEEAGVREADAIIIGPSDNLSDKEVRQAELNLLGSVLSTMVLGLGLGATTLHCYMLTILCWSLQKLHFHQLAASWQALWLVCAQLGEACRRMPSW